LKDIIFDPLKSNSTQNFEEHKGPYTTDSFYRNATNLYGKELLLAEFLLDNKQILLR
jgi:hypothetical protein